jgi:glycosyltransferase involved in cell wall biosynthesis
LIAYQSTASVLAGVLGRLVGCRMRIIHQTAMPEAVHPWVRALDKAAGSLGFYSVNIANSAATEAAFAGFPVRYRNTMRRIEHGIDPPHPTSAASVVRARHGIAPDSPLLVSAGRLSDQKALDRAIRALPLVADAHLALAGGGPNEAQLRLLAKDLGIADRVHFLGYLTRQHVADLLGAADVFVFPTVWETFGLAPVEAAMAGVPVVASDLPVLREVLSIEGATPARFVDSADAEALAAAVRQALHDGGARAMAKSFAPRLAAKYSMQRMLDRYAELIAQ